MTRVIEQQQRRFVGLDTKPSIRNSHDGNFFNEVKPTLNSKTGKVMEQFL